MTRLESQLDSNKNIIKKNKKELERLTGKYGSKDKLLFKLAEGLSSQKTLSTKIKSLEPLPPEVKDIDNFIQEYEAYVGKVDVLKGQYNNLLLQRAELENDMPDESAEELETQFTEATDEFDTVKRKANAISRISDVVLELSN